MKSRTVSLSSPLDIMSLRSRQDIELAIIQATREYREKLSPLFALLDEIRLTEHIESLNKEIAADEVFKAAVDKAIEEYDPQKTIQAVPLGSFLSGEICYDLQGNLCYADEIRFQKTDT